MRTCLVLMNHPLREDQVSQLQNDWRCDKIIKANLPSEVDPEKGTEAIIDLAKSICCSDVVQEHSWTGGVAVVQTEACLQTALVMELQDRGFTVVHATTRRVVSEDPDTGEKRSYFNHVKFRAYPKL